ncbi:MAG: recombinase RecA [Gracilimonas sp.]|uniref:gas vesicle protein GvpD n=1 Tax=Gracilimonas sp. TaxID=1974203 RepID=UPI0019874D88|nr:gas vesicle protein GvpD [Gracilimonas sp.]MBD3615214.1 recombinase RecA [Gracilimonas sp.]
MNIVQKISTGITGLDEILDGGLIPKQSYLIQGGPGTGKSTIGYHFLQQGVKENESSLYISFGESNEHVKVNAEKLGISLEGVHFLDLNPDFDVTKDFEPYSVFSPSEVETSSIFKPIVEAIDKYKPKRVFLDSITMFQFLNQDPFQTRNMALSFIKYICKSGATLLMTSELSEKSTEKEATFWVDGILTVEFTDSWRKISVAKYRGSDFRSGYHAFKINGNGFDIYPSLKPSQYSRTFFSDPVSSGIDTLDQMLHGGIEQGTTSLVTGPSGVGKTNLSVQFMKEAANRGERSAIYSFEESKEVIIRRSESINVPVRNMLDKGFLKIESVEPLSYSPDEFSKMVRQDVEEHNTKFVLIDSLGGYGMAVREENTLERLHSLTVYLQNMGVTTFLINETQSITGTLEATNIHASYLADNIIFLRYLELNGELHKAIGILKKRLSDFERSIREFDISKDGIIVGKKLTGLKGILSGIPEIS